MKTVTYNENLTIITVRGFTATIKGNVCTFNFESNNVTTADIIETIQEALIHANLLNIKLDLALLCKMHQVVCKGSYIARIKYIRLIGCVEQISRQTQFKDALDFSAFERILARNRINNFFASEFKSKRIVAVHPLYLEFDEEIREGLKVMQQKHPEDNTVIVNCEKALAYALKDCLPNATLVIDGHWTHNEQSRHGIWEAACAKEIAERIAELVNAHPGKISHVNLLGCESGKISNNLEYIVNKNLFFKYDHQAPTVDREMREMRNRAIYVSTNGENIFDPNSLAFQVLRKLHDPTIAVTATPKLLYPWPPEDPKYNIGSDTKNWKDKSQAWELNTTEDELSRKLGQVKSITQVTSKTTSKCPWALRHF